LPCPSILTLLRLPCARRPTSSTLFPYTTLFRSCSHMEPRAGKVDQAAGVIGVGVREHDIGHHRRLVSQCAQPPVDALLGRELGADRKSTRLNSSHVKISYAVFRLNKTNPPPAFR